jgi:hypothetical protein
MIGLTFVCENLDTNPHVFLIPIRSLDHQFCDVGDTGDTGAKMAHWRYICQPLTTI